MTKISSNRWRLFMMTSSNGNIFRVTGPLCGDFTGPGEFPTQRPVTRSFDVFFDLRLNKRLSKHSWGWWFEKLSYSLWRHHNVWTSHDDVIKWKHFPRYWPFVREIHRSPMNSPHKGQWRGALMYSLICAWINGWVNNRETGDLRRNRAHYDVNVMELCCAARIRVLYFNPLH